MKKEKPLFDSNLMNDELVNLYCQIPEKVSNKVDDYNMCHNNKLTNPYLLSISKEYFNASFKIMMISQETYDWEGVFDCGMIPNHVKYILISLKTKCRQIYIDHHFGLCTID